MIESFQEQTELQKSSGSVTPHEYATIGAVYEDGISLIFDDNDAESTKHYLSASNVKFTSGDRVKIRKTFGTYIIEYAVASTPTQKVTADFASAAQRLGADPGDLISFFGTDPIGKQTINLSSNNMGYTSVTASNYLYALNNLIGILKNKYGLIL